MRARLLVGTCLIALVAAIFAFPVIASAAGMTNAQCMECHTSIRPQNFHVGAVNRDTACKKCHVDSFVGTHPYHNSTANCGAICHPGMGASLASAVPSVLTTGGAFATAISQDTSPALLHIIHANQRWETSLIKNGNDCGRCHAASACTACHDDVAAPVASVHANHASTSTTVTPWVGDVSYGLPTGKVTGAVVRCGAPTCHNTAGVAAAKPGLMENYNASANPAADFLATTVSYVGSWRTTYGAAYSRGQESVGINPGAELSATFTGQRVYLISDRDQYRGIAEVFLDNVSQGTIDLYNPVTKTQAVVWKSESLATGTHTIKVRVTGGQNPNARAAYVAVDQFKVYAGVPASVAPNCTDSCHPDKASGHGTFTWPHEATQTAGNSYNGGTGNYRCDSCHSMVFLTEHGRTTSTSYGKGCSNCHSTYAPMSITGTWVANDGCNYSQCHASATVRQPHTAISTSHTASTETTQQPCRDCHAGDLSAVHNNSITTNAYTTNCNTCHAPAKYPASKSCSAQGCHDASGVRLVDDHAVNATFIARHTPTTFTLAGQSPGPDGAIATGGKECSTCHTARLDTKHATTSMGAVGCTSGGTSNTGCHFNTSLNTMNIARTGWATEKCAECHDYGTARTHDTTVTAHSVASGACAGTAGCHTSTSLWAIHANRPDGVTAPTYASCNNVACHDAGNKDKRPTLKTCGAGNACHTVSNPHKPALHTSTRIECTSCHGSTDIQVIHVGVGNGCNVCHGGGGYTDVAAGKTADCVGCHNASGVGVKKTYSPITTGHYVGTETSHTATSAQSAATLAWGTNPACGACHNMQLNPEHARATSSKTTSPTSTCENCHLSTVFANSATVVAGKWSARGSASACIACHAVDTATNQHGQVAITGNHSVTGDTQSCATSGAGCHPVSNVVQVGTPSTTANIHTACASCHGTAARAGLVVPGALATGCTGNTSCHGTGYATNNHNARTGNETVHVATGMTTVVGAYTYNNTCAACHSAGLSLAHTDTSTTVNLVSGNTGWNSTAQSSCRDCHNAAATANTVASSGVIKANWSTKTCDACHTTLHNSINNHNSTAASGCTLSTGCHGYTGSTLDVRAVHDKLNIGCTASGTDSKGWSGGCHKVDKAMSTTAMSCGTGATGQACHTNHTASNHMPAHDANDAESVNCTKSGCHEAGPTRSIATTSVISLHATDTIGVTVSGKTNNGCNICHGGNGWTDVHATAKANATGFQCVGCHNGTVVGTHTYTGRDGTSLHYTSNATTHTAAAVQSGINYTGGYACTQCHSLDMWAAHTGPTSAAFSTVPGTYSDKCRACHESKVDAFTPTTWDTKLCSACHTTLASHNATATAHNATNAAIPTPGLAWADVAPTGGFSDGFESNSFGNWTSANLYQPSGTETLVWDAGMENWTSLTAPTTPLASRAFDTVTTTTQWSLRTAQANGAVTGSADYARYSSTTAQSARLIQLSSGLNLSGYSSARVDWYDVAALFNAAGNTASLQWTKDGGATWTTEWTITAINEGTLGLNTWAAHSVTIPSAKLSNNCGVRFSVTSTANGTARTFYVDELHVTGISAPVTGGWATTSTANPPSTYAAGACGTGPAWYYLTETGIGMTGADSATLSYAIKWNTLEAADSVVAQYTTDGGATWTSAKTYAPSGVDPATQAWKVETLTGLPATANGIRFGFYADNTTGDQLYIDDVSLSAAVNKPASTAGVSCMNNPNGTECHDVADVAALHNNTVSKCTACHKNNTTVPTIECQTSGCHAGVNLGEHVEKGTGPAHHENGGSFATYAVANECAGCHDDSVANEHFVLTANTSKPCSVCHKTNYTVGTYSPAKATVTARITAKAINCDGCHTTSTATSPHAQRRGTTTTLGSAQFQTNWSGHRSWSTMPGSKTSWTTAVDGATQSLTLPTGTWLNTGWTSTSMVLCSDCHGSITGSSGPHGAAMSVNIAAGYDNSYSAGTLILNSGTTMSNTTNLCAKCHPAASTYNNAHNGSSSHGVACIACHVKTPHAWKRPRLIGYTTDPAPYASTMVTGIQTTVTNATTGWSDPNCGAIASCGTHPTALSTSVWP